MINPKEYKEGQEYRCPLCKTEKFQRRKAMMEHLQAQHLDHLYADLLLAEGAVKEELMKQQHLPCTTCNRTFRLQSALDKHREKHVQEAKNAVTDPTISPVKAPPSSESHNAQQQQQQQQQQDQDASPLPTLQQQQQQLQRADLAQTLKTCQCRYCDKSFTRDTVLRMHLEMVHADQVKRDRAESPPEDSGETEVAEAAAPEAASSSSAGVKRTSPSPGESPSAKKISLPRTSIFVAKGASVPTQSVGPRPQRPGGSSSSFLSKAAAKVLFAPRPQTAPHLHMHHLQTISPRPRLPILPPPTVGSNSGAPVGTHGGGGSGGGSSGGGGGSGGRGSAGARGIRTNGAIYAKKKKMDNGNHRTMAVGGRESSSEEDDEGIPKHANVIMKRIRNDDDDADWTSSVRRVSVGTVRCSTRIKTKRQQQKEEDESTQSSTESNGHAGPTNEAGNSSSNAKVNGAGSGKEVVPITRPYAPPAADKDKAEASEVCVVEGCDRKFFSYFSMMRHVAFKHQPERTMFYMKLRETEPPPVAGVVLKSAEDLQTNELSKGEVSAPGLGRQEETDEGVVADSVTELPKEQETPEPNKEKRISSDKSHEETLPEEAGDAQGTEAPVGEAKVEEKQEDKDAGEKAEEAEKKEDVENGGGSGGNESRLSPGLEEAAPAKKDDADATEPEPEPTAPNDAVMDDQEETAEKVVGAEP